MQKWEYLVVEMIDAAFSGVKVKIYGSNLREQYPLTDFLDKAGKDGWEMTGTTDFPHGIHLIYLKREVPD